MSLLLYLPFYSSLLPHPLMFFFFSIILHSRPFLPFSSFLISGGSKQGTSHSLTTLADLPSLIARGMFACVCMCVYVHVCVCVCALVYEYIHAPCAQTHTCLYNTRTENMHTHKKSVMPSSSPHILLLPQFHDRHFIRRFYQSRGGGNGSPKRVLYPPCRYLSRQRGILTLVCPAMLPCPLSVSSDILTCRLSISNPKHIPPMIIYTRAIILS
jgi:hypothetical protein